MCPVHSECCRQEGSVRPGLPRQPAWQVSGAAVVPAGELHCPCATRPH